MGSGQEQKHKALLTKLGEQNQLISRTDNATSKAKSSQFANDEKCVVQVESYLLDREL